MFHPVPEYPPRCDTDPDYKKVWEMLKYRDLHKSTDFLYWMCGSYEYFLIEPEGMLEIVLGEMTSDKKRKEKFMECIRHARDECKDPAIIKERNEWEKCWNQNKEMQAKNPIDYNDARICSNTREINKKFNLSLETYDDIRLFAFGGSNNINMLQQLPQTEEIISKLWNNTSKFHENAKCESKYDEMKEEKKSNDNLTQIEEFMSFITSMNDRSSNFSRQYWQYIESIEKINNKNELEKVYYSNENIFLLLFKHFLQGLLNELKNRKNRKQKKNKNKSNNDNKHNIEDMKCIISWCYIFDEFYNYMFDKEINLFPLFIQMNNFVKNDITRATNEEKDNKPNYHEIAENFTNNLRREWVIWRNEEYYKYAPPQILLNKGIKPISDDLKIQYQYMTKIRMLNLWDGVLPDAVISLIEWILTNKTRIVINLDEIKNESNNGGNEIDWVAMYQNADDDLDPVYQEFEKRMLALG